MRVIVIGGGISGLAAGYWIDARLRAQGRSVDVSVLDAGASPGGNVRTVREAGFQVEAGPNGWLDREPAARALLRDLGLESRLIESRPAARHRYIVRGGRLCRVPDSPPALLASRALSPLGKLRLMLEPWAPGPPAVEETVFEFARRRIGAEASEYLVDAAVSGISAGDSRRLSVRAAFPLMVEMEREHGSLIRAMIARKKSAGPARVVSLDQGLGLVVESLAKALGARLRTRAEAQSVRRTPDGWRVRLADGAELAADRVVLALPAPRATRLVESLDPELADELGRVPAAGLAVVALAYRASDVARALDGYGYLVTRGERQQTLGVVWESSLFDGRAPEGAVLLRAMIGGVRHPECMALSPDALVARAVAEMNPLVGLRGEPLRRWVFRWPSAIPQYELGHLKRVERLRGRAARHPGLDLCGTSYDGISFASGIVAADRLAARFAAEAMPEAAPQALAAAGSVTEAS